MADESLDLKQLAIDLAEGKVFSSSWILEKYPEEEHARITKMVFMPLAFMEKKEVEEYFKDCAMIYEYLHKAGPRSVNGLPMFMSMGKITREEIEQLRDYLKRYLEMKEKL